MARIVEYDRATLKGLFHECDWDSLTQVRCTDETASAGRHLQAGEDRERSALVRVVCRPAFAISIRLEYQWSAEVLLEDGPQLDWGVVAGVMAGLTSGEYPAWLCSVAVTEVVLDEPSSGVESIRTAAQLAVESALESSKWRLQTRPRGSAPHGDEPA